MTKKEKLGLSKNIIDYVFYNSKRFNDTFYNKIVDLARYVYKTNAFMYRLSKKQLKKEYEIGLSQSKKK